MAKWQKPSTNLFWYVNFCCSAVLTTWKSIKLCRLGRQPPNHTHDACRLMVMPIVWCISLPMKTINSICWMEIALPLYMLGKWTGRGHLWWIKLDMNKSIDHSMVYFSNRFRHLFYVFFPNAAIWWILWQNVELTWNLELYKRHMPMAVQRITFKMNWYGKFSQLHIFIWIDSINRATTLILND